MAGLGRVAPLLVEQLFTLLAPDLYVHVPGAVVVRISARWQLVFELTQKFHRVGVEAGEVPHQLGDTTAWAEAHGEAAEAESFRGGNPYVKVGGCGFHIVRK